MHTCQWLCPHNHLLPGMLCVNCLQASSRRRCARCSRCRPVCSRVPRASSRSRATARWVLNEQMRTRLLYLSAYLSGLCEYSSSRACGTRYWGMFEQCGGVGCGQVFVNGQQVDDPETGTRSLSQYDVRMLYVHPCREPPPPAWRSSAVWWKKLCCVCTSEAKGSATRGVCQ